eukprot:TRINITY_DN11546_c0_g1_i1.p1 TRINITY_DN11546_c0_g1~~TRINITY_DN11546_c0_g1_i1.p1  ORF type:complete len:534 (+),score=85.30 TRINITY_DN11546_c0_g1_i1:43-1644(+)
MITLEEKAREYLAIAVEYMKRGISAQEKGNMVIANESYTQGVSVCDEGLAYVHSQSGDWTAKYHQAMTKTRRSMVDQLSHMKNTAPVPSPKPNDPSVTVQTIKPKPEPKPEPKPDSKPGFFSRWMKKTNKDDPPPPSYKNNKGDDNDAHLRRIHSHDNDKMRKTLDASSGSKLRGMHADGNSKLRATIGTTPKFIETNTAPMNPSNPRVGYTKPPNNRPEAPPKGTGAPSKSDLLKKHEEKYVSAILNDVINPSEIGVTWSDVTGLEVSKQHLQEAVVWPMLRPDLFSGLRTPPKGVLLYGPPGNGKTMLAKAVACESKATFFSISASSIVSRFLGDGEKMVKALFACAEHLSPSVVFIDEVDSLLAARGEEHEAMRRIKTEFLVQMDGVGTSTTARVLVLAATNRPQDIDTACLRRFQKRVLIPLPCKMGREAHLSFLSSKDPNTKFKLSNRDLAKFSEITDGYSYSDLTALVREAAIIPLRKLGSIAVQPNEIPAVTIKDIMAASKIVRPSTTKSELVALQAWTEEYGSAG